MVTDLPTTMSTFGSSLDISFLNNEFGFLNPGQEKSFLLQNKHNDFDSGDGLLFFVKGVCICLIPRKNFVFLFDSHSRNELGQPCPNGFSMLIKFKNKREVEKYILRTYIGALDANVSYELVNWHGTIKQ